MVAKYSVSLLIAANWSGFNPCSGGLWLLRNEAYEPFAVASVGFNPCSGGLWLLSI